MHISTPHMQRETKRINCYKHKIEILGKYIKKQRERKRENSTYKPTRLIMFESEFI